MIFIVILVIISYLVLSIIGAGIYAFRLSKLVGDIRLIDFKTDILPAILVWILFTAVLLLIFYPYYRERTVPFEFVLTLDQPHPYRNEYIQGWWTGIYAHGVDYAIGTSEIERLLSYTDGSLTMDDFDVDRYTYVITYGCTLEKLTYNRINVYGYITTPKSFYYEGKAWLDNTKCTPTQIFIYKIAPIRISCDYHASGNTARMVFVK